jgi:hypothetical protein
MPKRTIGQGENIPSIAAESGFFSDTIWNHPENAKLKELRKDMNVLMVGDEVFVPEKTLREESGATEQKHRFKRKGEPHKLKMKLMAMGKPRANEEYVIDIGGRLINGKTDAGGKIEQTIPGSAGSGTLILRGGKEKHAFSVGNLDPIDEVSGVQQRLNNLGFNCGPEDGKMSDTLSGALTKFQAKHNLPVTGKIDDNVKAKLKEFYP